jgi:hypothetical protein
MINKGILKKSLCETFIFLIPVTNWVTIFNFHIVKTASFNQNVLFYYLESTMAISIEDAQQFILAELRKAQKKSVLNSSELHWANYDVHLNTTVTKLMHIEKIPDPNQVGSSINRNYQERQALDLKINTLRRAVSDALWELCRRGILRPGTNHVGSMHASVNEIHEGFTVTTYGQNWLEAYTQEDTLPATPDRFTQIFDGFQRLKINFMA